MPLWVQLSGNSHNVEATNVRGNSSVWPYATSGFLRIPYRHGYSSPWQVPVLAAEKVGDSIELAVLRKGENLKLSVKTGELGSEVTRVALPAPAPLSEVTGETLGLQLEDAGGAGARVATLIPDSPASRADLRPKDIITEVNGEPVADASAARSRVKNAIQEQSPKGVLVNFLREGKKKWAVIERPMR